jgi:hypothetical protein
VENGGKKNWGMAENRWPAAACGGRRVTRAMVGSGESAVSGEGLCTVAGESDGEKMKSDLK